MIKEKTFPASVIASWFIHRSIVENVELTPMKLQKLVFFAHGIYLSQSGCPLIAEAVQAWQFGPVIASIYHQYKFIGNKDIKTHPIFLSIERENVLREVTLVDEATSDFLEMIWTTFKPYSPAQMSTLTHLKNSPWDKAVSRNGGIGKNLIIQDKTIEDYFKTDFFKSNARTQNAPN